MKKSVSAFLSSLLVLSTSCAGGTQAPEVTSAKDTDSLPIETAEPTRLDELGDKSFGGKTFTILIASDSTNPDNMPFEEKRGEVLNDSLFARDLKIGELYDVNIEYIDYGSAAESCKAYSSSYLAGDHYCDLIFSTITESTTIRPLITQGMLANLRDYDVLSLDKPWWSSLINEAVTYDGKQYFTSGDINPTSYISGLAMAVNTDLLADYFPEMDMYETVMNGEWTLDTLLTLSQTTRDLNGDNVIHTDTDFLGFAYGDVACFTGGGLPELNAFFTGADIPFTTEKDGELTVSLGTEKTLTVVEKLRQIIPFNSTSSRDDYMNLAFKDNRALVIQLGFLNTTLRAFDCMYYYLPSPKYDAAQENYRTLVNGWACAFVAIPNTDIAEDSAFISEALAYESYKNVRPAIYDNILMQKAARDEKSQTLLNVIIDSLYIDFGTIYEFGGIQHLLAKAVYLDSPLMSGFASLERTIENDIANLTANW